VVDNGSSHRGQASVDRLERQWANLRLVHLPVHASWLNQIEIYCSVVQRKVVAHNDCTDLAEVEARLLAFQRRYEQTAAPFDWHFTRSDLDRLLRRLEEHQQPARAASPPPTNLQTRPLSQPSQGELSGLGDDLDPGAAAQLGEDVADVHAVR
jgi:hypothetical protein